MKIEQKMSLRIVENKKVICKTCLFSEPLGSLSGAMEDCGMIVCKADRDNKQKGSEEFCKDGLWLLNGEPVDFKTAFKAVYDPSDNSKDLGKVE